MAFLGIRYELGQGIICEYDSSGVLRTQPDGAGDAPRLGSYETLHPLGFAARAAAAKTGQGGAPLAGGGCKVRVGYDGTDIQVELLGDHRDVARIPPLPEEGGAVMYAPGSPVPSFYVVRSDDGTHQLYVEVGDSSHTATVGYDGNGDPIIEWVHARGMALTLFKDAAILKNRTGNCYVELKDDGGNLVGNWKVSGAFDVGATSFPLVKFPALATELAAVQAALVAAGAALEALTKIGVNAAAQPASAAAVAAVGAAAAALATFATAGPTLFTKGS